MKMKKLKFTPLQIAVHVGAWSLVAWLVYDFFAGNMSVNPIQEITQRTGRYAIWFLVASLACTPVNTIFKFPQALTARRPLGIYAFMFASFHFMTFIGLDYQFNLSLLYGAIFEKRFVVVGLLVFLILLALAITSTKGWQKRLGKNWKRLHKLVYIAGMLVVLHYAWAKKGDIFRLKGDIVLPLVIGVLIAIFLILRIPAVKRQVTQLRGRIQKAFKSGLKPAPGQGSIDR